MNTQTARTCSGFTLIELLVVIGIMGVLMAIAIPQYSAYKARAFDTRAQVDLRNVALAEEAYFLEAERYLSCAQTTCAGLPGIVRLSTGVSLAITATTSGFLGTSTHGQGSGRRFVWNSQAGGLQEGSQR
jgi:type IV pilus assembly protein PilA